VSLDLDELGATTRNDYRRANGAPMVNVDGKNERYSRPSSFAKPLDDESALVNWKIDRAAVGVAYDKALQAEYVAVASDDREQLGKLREKAIAAGRGAERADIGTALHAMSCRWEQKEEGFAPPEPYFSSLCAYTNELQRLGLESLRYEFHTVNREYRCAGTADRLYETTMPLVTPEGDVLPVGTLLVGDLKTGGKLEFSKPGYAVQLALYAFGEFYDVVQDEFLATPPINQRWAIIVHMPADEPGACEFLWCDLEVGRWGCYLVQQVKLWRKNWRSGEFAIPPVTLDSNLQRSFEGEPICWRCHSALTSYPGPPAEPICDGCYAELKNPDLCPHGEASHEQCAICEGEGPFPATTCFCGRPDDDAVVHQNNAPCYVLIDDEAELLAEWVEWIALRVKLIGDNTKAREMLLRMWPEGVPVPRKIEHRGQVDVIIPVLNFVEAEFSLGFVEQPTALQSTGPRHERNK
jgi:hypothetical protein